MIYGSVCSGIEAASVAWHPLGWRASFLSDIEAFPRAVLAHHYPETPLHGDFTTISAGQYEPIDLLVGGTPCQSFSVAGLRCGMDDERGNLSLEYLRLADRLRPRWMVWENVPGVLSSNGGRDFGAILGGMVELGYGIAYRVLDAQFFGVAQRRRRVFVIGYIGDWRRAAAVLSERHSLSGHPSPRRETRKDLAPTISARPTGGGGLGTDFDLDGGLISQRHIGETAPTLNAAFGSKLGLDNQHIDSGAGLFVEASSCIPINADALRGEGTARTPSPDAEGRIRLRDPGFGVGNDGDPAGTLAAAGPGAVAFTCSDQANSFAWERPYAPTIGAQVPSETSNIQTGVRLGSTVRRLTPRECERLQGFPDDYTLIPYRKGQAADGPRYKALGNSMAVPVMRWIGERIQAVEDMTASDASLAQGG